MANSVPYKTRSWLLSTALIFVCLAVADYLTKRWAMSLPLPVDFGRIHIYAFGNSGVMGGYLSEETPWIIRIFFSVLFGFIAIAAALLAHFLRHKKLPLLKTGLFVYCAGALGNAWDRMSFGSVIDYLLIDLPGLRGMAFNLSDVVVFAGFVLIAIGIIKERDEIWFKRDQRQGSWIDGKFQGRFGLLFVLIGFSHFFVIALYSFAFLKTFVDQVIAQYLTGLFIIEVAALVLTFALSILFSHRLVGPLTAFEQYIRRQLKGSSEDTRPLRLRKGDYFQVRLEAIAQEISAKLGNQKPRE